MRAHAVVTCASPSGLEGEVIYNADYKVVQFCDGNSNWIKVGGVTTDSRIGTLTANKWCAANAGGTAFDCTQNAPVDTGMTALTGDVTASGSGSVAATIANSAVTYAKLQNASGPSLLGRSTAGAGVFSEITVGSGLALSSGTLSVSSGNASSGTAGYVQYSGGSGTFSSDSTASNQFFWDSTNHRLGIGTVSPSTKLHVVGQSLLSNVSGPELTLNSSGTNYATFYDTGTTGANGGIALGGAAAVTGTPAAATMFWNVNSGNVGIGATSPSQKLDVRGGGMRITTTDWAAGTTGSFIDFALNATTGNTYSKIQGYTDGGASPGNIAINAVAGNVGIGTTTPGDKLTVHEGTDLNIGFQSTGGMAAIVAHNDAWSAWSDINFGNSWVTMKNTGNVGIGAAFGGGPLLPLHVAGTPAAPATSGSTASGAVRIDNLATSGQGNVLDIGNMNASPWGAWLQAHSSGNNATTNPILLNPNGGSVGIGTTTPGRTLDVNGTMNVAGGVIARTSTGYGGSDLGLYSGQSGIYERFVTNNGDWVWSSDNTASAEKMHLTASGTLSCSSGCTNGISDDRMKTDIHQLGEGAGLASILRLKPVSFTWKDSQMSQVTQYGFLAQDVEKVLPDLVSVYGKSDILLKDGTHQKLDDTKQLAITGLIAPTIKAVQELKADNDNLRAANDNQETEIREMREEIKALKATLH